MAHKSRAGNPIPSPFGGAPHPNRPPAIEATPHAPGASNKEGASEARAGQAPQAGLPESMKLTAYKPEYTDLMTVGEFVAAVKHGLFTNDYGSGYYGTKDFYDRDLPALPSEISRGEGWKHGAFTHVHWFNK